MLRLIRVRYLNTILSSLYTYIAPCLTSCPRLRLSRFDDEGLFLRELAITEPQVWEICLVFSWNKYR